jgi:exosortase
MNQAPENGVLEEFRLEFADFWQRLPNKAFFLVLAAAWLVLFQFLGSSTLGYVHSPSLYRWMLDAYHPGGKFMESEDGHGVLVPFVVLALFWWKRKSLLAVPIRTWWPGMLLVALALALHLFAYLVQQPKISVVALFLGLYGLMGAAWGPAWLRESFFPFLLFAFCVPLGTQMQAVSFPLRLLVCRLVEIATAVLGLEVVRNGTGLINATQGYQYDVAAACSGMRSLIATIALAICFAFISFRTWKPRVVMIASAFPLAVLGNFLRMMAIVIAAEFGGQTAGNYVHEGGPAGLLSLIPYVPAFIGLIWIEGWLRRRRPENCQPIALKERPA